MLVYQHSVISGRLGARVLLTVPCVSGESPPEVPAVGPRCPGSRPGPVSPQVP